MERVDFSLRLEVPSSFAVAYTGMFLGHVHKEFSLAEVAVIFEYLDF